MQHYEDSNGSLFGVLDDGSQNHLIQSDWVLIDPSELELKTQVAGAKIEAERKGKMNYAQLRASEYPQLLDYIDGIVKGNTTQMQAYIDACVAVKAKYPKE